MIYDIQSKTDFSTGTMLVVRIPEDDLDKKALYTIQTDIPKFILPFHFRSIDGQIEFTYQIETRSKIQYLTGDRSTKEYAGLWTSILMPLLDCGDWFMKPYSFVLRADHLYFDKNSKTVSYVYIPSKQDCSDYHALKDMAAELTKIVSVADTQLENKLLRAIMENFNPRNILMLIKPYAADPVSAPAPQKISRPKAEESAPPPIQSDSLPSATDKTPSPVPGDIVINLKGSSAAKAEKSPKKPKSSGKKAKLSEKPKSGGLFGKKKNAQIILGAGSEPKQNEIKQEIQIDIQSDPRDEVTQLASGDLNGTGFRLIGNASFPIKIEVNVAENSVFTIGRFDVSVGRQQSSFEFDQKTKAVSRRHAAVERRADGYRIIDLSSSAGTFVNGQKLPANMPCKLERGSRVSFGNSGADYIWEE